jgi:DNA-binding IclR family transcriptional regulator
MPLAEWSDKTAIKDEDYMSFAMKIRELDEITVEIGELKIRGGGVDRNFCHPILLCHAVPIPKIENKSKRAFATSYPIARLKWPQTQRAEDKLPQDKAQAHPKHESQEAAQGN